MEACTGFVAAQPVRAVSAQKCKRCQILAPSENALIRSCSGLASSGRRLAAPSHRARSVGLRRARVITAVGGSSAFYPKFSAFHPELLIKDFTLQRAIQTLLVYQTEMGNGTGARFLENFAGQKGVGKYHGFRGMKIPWNEYLESMLKAEVTELVIRKPMRRQGSPGNPYIEQKYFEYTEEVNPAKVARLLMDVRAQTSKECAEDLKVIPRENELLRQQYLVEFHKQSKDELQKVFTHDFDPLPHDAMRSSTADLLDRMTTYCAVKQYMKTGENDAHRKWLAKFLEKEGAYFLDDAVPRFRVARDFVWKMMLEPPIMSCKPGEEEPCFTEPLGLSKEIMRLRAEIASLWTSILEEQIEQDHADLSRKVLQMNLEATENREKEAEA
ncbi:hypothetical protein FVE85_1592 [Porphyridium purpureum]|uniref:Uncharacterized protein n=1 Tax=Porphyridium purpureum TaxID=35688 RepID=A0A5J4YY84_PORPP|nr:hypothetical protein FVE85_1592 [Porphyridium purpureum]|eukprot:POR5799..scf209_3